MLSTQARRDRSHGLVPRKRLSEHLQLDTFHLRPITAENLLITAYMPAELAQIDFGKKLIEIFKKSEKPFSIRKKKTPFPSTQPNFQTKIDFLTFENIIPIQVLVPVLAGYGFSRPITQTTNKKT